MDLGWIFTIVLGIILVILICGIAIWLWMVYSNKKNKEVIQIKEVRQEPIVSSFSTTSPIRQESRYTEDEMDAYIASLLHAKDKLVMDDNATVNVSTIDNTKSLDPFAT